MCEPLSSMARCDTIAGPARNASKVGTRRNRAQGLEALVVASLLAAGGRCSDGFSMSVDRRLSEDLPQRRKNHNWLSKLDGCRRLHDASKRTVDPSGAAKPQRDLARVGWVDAERAET